MSWGHAVSRDLVHWQHLPVALREENGVMIFSGSAVVDRTEHERALRRTAPRTTRAWWPSTPGTVRKEQTQNLAYSNDRGRTWTKYAGNPVIDLGLKDFRDPKVFWHEPTKRWIMVTALLADEHKVRFFGSATSSAGRRSATSARRRHGRRVGVPRPLPAAGGGRAGEMRWVLDVDINPGGVAGGSGGQYFVGPVRRDDVHERQPRATDALGGLRQGLLRDHVVLRPSRVGRPPHLDGLDRQLAIRHRGAHQSLARSQTIPRLLKLRRTPQGIRLVQEPVVEMQTLRERRASIKNQSAAAANSLLQSKGVRGDALEIEAEVDPGSATKFGFEVR